MKKTLLTVASVVVIVAAAAIVPTAANAAKKKMSHAMGTLHDKVMNCMGQLPTDPHMSNNNLTHQFMECMSK